MDRKGKSKSISSLLERMLAGEVPGRRDLRRLLSLTNPLEMGQLFAAARAAREKHFGSSVYLYGFLYFSTHCRNNCSFCQFRRTNSAVPRYRKDRDEILAAAEKMADSGIHTIDLTMGEDPAFFSSPDSSNSLAEIVTAVKTSTDLPVMISPGVMPDEMIEQMARSGVDWYACYQETYSKAHFQELRPLQSFDKRMQAKHRARDAGILIEEGLLLGTGESMEDLIDSLYSLAAGGADQVRAMTYRAHPGITTTSVSSHVPAIETLTIAVMRLLMPDRFIPASLDIDGLAGLEVRLNAGANIITSLVPPEQGLAGVVNTKLDIEESRRTVEHVAPVVQSCGLEIGDKGEYIDWLVTRKQSSTSTIVDGDCLMFA